MVLLFLVFKENKKLIANKRGSQMGKRRKNQTVFQKYTSQGQLIWIQVSGRNKQNIDGSYCHSKIRYNACLKTLTNDYAHNFVLLISFFGNDQVGATICVSRSLRGNFVKKHNPKLHKKRPKPTKKLG